MVVCQILDHLFVLHMVEKTSVIDFVVMAAETAIVLLTRAQLLQKNFHQKD